MERGNTVFVTALLVVSVLFGWLWWDTGVKLGRYDAVVKGNSEQIESNKQLIGDSRALLDDNRRALREQEKMFVQLILELKELNKRQEAVLRVMEKVKEPCRCCPTTSYVENTQILRWCDADGKR